MSPTTHIVAVYESVAQIVVSQSRKRYCFGILKGNLERTQRIGAVDDERLVEGIFISMRRNIPSRATAAM